MLGQILLLLPILRSWSEADPSEILLVEKSNNQLNALRDIEVQAALDAVGSIQKHHTNTVG